MKQLILLSIIAICFVKISTAQDVELIDSNQYNLSYKIMADSCLKNVNLDSVPYGILLEKAFYKIQSINFG